MIHCRRLRLCAVTVVLGALAVLGGVHRANGQKGHTAGGPIPKPTLDGNLADFKAIAQMINSQGLNACAREQTDNIANGPSPGFDGFQDEPLQDDATPQIRFMHSPINVGNAIFIYVPDSDGIISPPSQDDSWLAIGVNVANGDGDVCVEDPNTPGIDCALGCVDDPMTNFDDCAIIKLDTPPDLPLNVMVPFDADGNGNPCILGTGVNSRWFPSAPVLTFDESTEAINLAFFLCAFTPGDLTGADFSIIYQQRNQIATELVLDSFNPSLFSLFPPVGSTCNQIRDRGLDGIVGADGLGNDDIEILVDKFDSQVSAMFPGEDYLSITRFRLANMGLTSRSDSSGDLSNEDSMFVLCPLEIPDIEVTKEVRCTGEGAGAWRDHVVTLPGSTVEFKIEVENTGNVPLAVTLSDVLSEILPINPTVNLNSLQATLFRPSDIGVGVAINSANAGSFGLNPIFFTPGPLGFLGGVAADQPRDLGNLQGVTACAMDPQLGDRIVLTFSVGIGDPANFCDSPQTEVDITNRITATGVPLPPFESDAVTDAADLIDTVREDIQNFDDNVTTVDVLCRDIDMLKEVRLFPGGTFVTGLDRLDIPNGPFPLQVEYRYTVHNDGDVEEDVVLTDEFLCQDIAAAAGVDFVAGQCALCQGVPPGEAGQITDSLAAGTSDMYTCRVNFTSLTALRAFLMLDDGRDDCRALNDMGGADTRCYRNCASATFTADLGASCDNVPARDVDSFATICNRECELLVTKDVRCILDDCGSPAPSEFGPFEEDSMQVAPGSCVQYCIDIENVGVAVPICSLRLTDMLSNQPGDITPIPGSVTLEVDGNSCPAPGCFNSTGTPCVYNTASCPGFPGGNFQEGQTITVCFSATIPTNANASAPDPINMITVEGASECPAGGPVFSCMDDDNVALDILPASLTCSGKQWAFQSDSDADCEPNAPFSAFAPNIDLRDDVFPVLLRLRIQGSNTGQIPLQVTATDTALTTCVNNLADIAFVPGQCELGTTKLVQPGATGEWFCNIRIETAAAARALDGCDGATNGVYNNTASVSGVSVMGGTEICTSPEVTIQGINTCSATIQVPPPCDFTVTKDVVCVDGCPNGAPTGTPGPTLDVIPGSRARYDIRVVNNSTLVKIPRICVSDLLECPSWLCGGDLGDSLRATIGASNVTDGFAGFTVNGVEQCFVFDSRPAAPWIAPGETLLISFEVQIPENATEDCTNSVSIEGYSEVCAPPPDASCDTGSDSAEIRILEPDIECTKEVRAFNTQGLNAPFTTDLSLPCNTAFPLSLEYRFTVRNTGETSLTNVRICDPDLAADAVAAGFGVGACAIAGSPDGCATLGTLAPGGMVSALCTLTVPSRAAFELFTGSDGDPETDCYNNTSTASGRASGTGLCRGVDDIVDSDCSARVCLAPQCDLAVTKQVRCLDSCGGPPIGNFQDSVQVAPGTCVEFQVDITNNSPEASICRLRITDTLSGGAGNIALQSGTTFRIGASTCTVPAGFNVTGTPFEFNPTACTGSELLTGQTLRINFRAQVPAGANPTVTPVNTVNVEGAPQCPNGVPNYCCTGMDTASIDILRPALTCNGKEWRYQWDSDADCQPEPPFSAFSSSIDLRDKVFPVLLELRVNATNDGEVPLNVVAADASFINCVDIVPGVSIVSPPTCELSSPTAKLILPGGSASWTCQIRIDSGQAARFLDTCDGTTDNVYRNTATVTGTMVTGGTPICVPPNTQVQGTDDCDAQILIPPPCDLETTKDVVCISGCTNGTPSGTPTSSLQILPGGFARYVVEIDNASPVVKVPRVCLTDMLTCPSWRCAGGPIRATLGGTDVSADFAGLTLGGTRQCFNITSRPAAPWIAPGETLTISFDVQVPADFNIPGGNPDCQNTITSEGYTEVCGEQPPLMPNNQCRSTDTASIDVRTSKIVCNKRVSVDIGDDGSEEFNNVTSVAIDSSTFPIRLTYKFGAINGGETTLNNICITDDQLLFDAAAAGIPVGSCDLTLNSTCSGGGTKGGLIGTLAPGASSNIENVTCELLVQNQQQWSALGGSDLPRNGNDCYENIATATGTVSTTNICAPAGATTVSSGQCAVEVCVSGTNVCPITKAKFDIWNENEVRFSGTERCIISWDERYLSNYTEIGHANHFVRNALQTDKGKARVDGVRSPVVCGADSIPAPLLGVAAKRMTFPGEDVIETAGTTISGSGFEPGKIRYSVPIPPKPAVGPEDRPNPWVSTDGGGLLPAPSEDQPGELEPSGDPERLAEDFGLAVNPVSGISQKGSLIVFPKVEIKWDSTGTLIQDTFVTIANDFDADVRVQMYFVNGDQPTAAILQGDPPTIVERAHPGCNWVDNQIALTNDESAYWSVLTGTPKGVSPFTILDPGIVPGRPDTDPHNPGGRVIRGYVVAWAINVDSHEIRWNHLTGTATIVNYGETAAWTYSAWAFQAVVDVDQGEELLNPLGTLDMDGLEYEYPPATLVFDFYASGARIGSQPGVSILLDTDLTLWVAIKDFLDAQGF